MSKKKTSKQPATTDVATLQAAVAKYELIFDELSQFVEFIARQKGELDDAEAVLAERKREYDAAKEEVQQVRDTIGGAKDSLYKMLEPGLVDYMPLFDRMEPADKSKHGERAAEWRTNPIGSLRLSPHATQILVDADIIFVGQLQDRVLANRTDWWESITGLTAATAASVADKLNHFIFEAEKG